MSEQTSEQTAAAAQRSLCLRCRHYFVSWDPARPYGCRAFGFKSTVLPCQSVQMASQLRCLKFEPK